MTQNADTEAVRVLIALVTRLLEEKDAEDREDIKAQLAAMSRGDITSAQIVNDLAVRFHLEFAPAIRALAQHDRAAALDLAERAAKGLDAVRAELGGRTAYVPATETAPSRRQTQYRFKDREDGVLLREFVMLRMLTRTDQPRTSEELFEASRKLANARAEELKDETVTSNLARLVKSEVVARISKGRFAQTGASRDYFDAVSKEIAKRGLDVPEA